MIDPTSPFASFGAGSVDDRRIGMKQIGTMKCTECGWEWTVPTPALQSACPQCKADKSSLVLLDGSVRLSGKPRV